MQSSTMVSATYLLSHFQRIATFPPSITMNCHSAGDGVPLHPHWNLYQLSHLRPYFAFCLSAPFLCQSFSNYRSQGVLAHFSFSQFQDSCSMAKKTGISFFLVEEVCSLGSTKNHIQDMCINLRITFNVHIDSTRYAIQQRLKTLSYGILDLYVFTLQLPSFRRTI